MYKNDSNLCDSSFSILPASINVPSYPHPCLPTFIPCHHNFERKTPKKFKKSTSFHGLLVNQNKLEVQKQEINKRREEELGRDSSAFKNIKKRKIQEILQIREILQKKNAKNQQLAFISPPSFSPFSNLQHPPSSSNHPPSSLHFSSKPSTFHFPSSSCYHPSPVSLNPPLSHHSPPSSFHFPSPLPPITYNPSFPQIRTKRKNHSLFNSSSFPLNASSLMIFPPSLSSPLSPSYKSSKEIVENNLKIIEMVRKAQKRLYGKNKLEHDQVRRIFQKTHASSEINTNSANNEFLSTKKMKGKKRKKIKEDDCIKENEILRGKKKRGSDEGGREEEKIELDLMRALEEERVNKVVFEKMRKNACMNNIKKGIFAFLQNSEEKKEAKEKKEEENIKEKGNKRGDESRFKDINKDCEQSLKHASTQFRARKVLNSSFISKEENEEDFERILAFMSELTDYKFDFLAERKIYLSAKQPKVDEQRKIIFSKFNRHPSLFKSFFHSSADKKEEEEKAKYKKLNEKTKEKNDCEKENDVTYVKKEEEELIMTSEEKREKPYCSLITNFYLEESFRRLRKECREEVKESKDIRRVFWRDGKKIKKSLEKLNKETNKFIEEGKGNRDALLLKKLLKYFFVFFKIIIKLK